MTTSCIECALALGAPTGPPGWLGPGGSSRSPKASNPAEKENLDLADPTIFPAPLEDGAKRLKVRLRKSLTFFPAHCCVTVLLLCLRGPYAGALEEP